MRRVVVHVDRLVLNGFRREDRHAIAAGLQQEFARVFADPVALSRLRARGDVPRMRVLGVPMEQGSRPEHIGENVAQGIGEEIAK